MRTRWSSHVYALSTEDFLGANFLELRHGEVRRIPLLGTSVNKVYGCNSGLLIEDVLNLRERVRGKNVSEP